MKKASAHFGRAMYYGAGVDFEQLSDPIIDIIIKSMLNGSSASGGNALLMLLVANKRFNVASFCLLPTNEMGKTAMYARTRHLIAKPTTIEWVRELMRPMRPTRPTSDGPTEPIVQMGRVIKERIIEEWYHLRFAYEFHGMSDIIHRSVNTDVTDDERSLCVRMMGKFMAHLDAVEPCDECAILKRDGKISRRDGTVEYTGPKEQIRTIIKGTFVPESIALAKDKWGAIDTKEIVDSYLNGWKILEPEKYGHFCVWRTDQLSSMEGMCAGITGPGFTEAQAWKDKEWDVRLWDTRRVTSMKGAFEKNQGLMSGVEAWNVGSVTNMSQMFHSSRAFNRVIGMWDTSKVTNMSSMFEGASEFNQNIGMWDTSKVTVMESMFDGAIKFNQNIGMWDTSNVTDMRSMFVHSWNFNQDLTKWKLRPDALMTDMFDNATKMDATRKPAPAQATVS
jgi:surface protein